MLVLGTLPTPVAGAGVAAGDPIGPRDGALAAGTTEAVAALEAIGVGDIGIGVEAADGLRIGEAIAETVAGDVLGATATPGAGSSRAVAASATTPSAASSSSTRGRIGTARRARSDRRQRGQNPETGTVSYPQLRQRTRSRIGGSDRIADTRATPA